jgi:hypothetical protein
MALVLTSRLLGRKKTSCAGDDASASFVTVSLPPRFLPYHCIDQQKFARYRPALRLRRRMPHRAIGIPQISHLSPTHKQDSIHPNLSLCQPHPTLSTQLKPLRNILVRALAHRQIAIRRRQPMNHNARAHNPRRIVHREHQLQQGTIPILLPVLDRANDRSSVHLRAKPDRTPIAAPGLRTRSLLCPQRSACREHCQ